MNTLFLIGGVVTVVFCVALSPFRAQAESRPDLVEVRSLDPSILVDLAYAREDNIFGRPFYERSACLLLRPAAEALVRAQTILRGMGLGLKCLDCYRPLGVQQEMWRVFPDPKYVARPEHGSNHNRGIAVDATLVDADGRELPMPTAFDDFSPRAASGFRDLPEEVLRNRELLHKVMRDAGFAPYGGEWWHFDYIAGKGAPLLSIPLHDLE